MKKHISFPSIEQFRNICSYINKNYAFIGIQNGEPVYDVTLLKPTIKFRGTVKLHGTNASVCYNATDGYWVQSRENIITPEKDNAGFAFLAESNKVEFLVLINKVLQDNSLKSTDCTVSIYGEWVGKGVQKSVGVSNLDKSFFIIGVKISPNNEEPAYWVESNCLSCFEKRIYNINDYETYSLDVDFIRPDVAQNKLIEYTIEVEKECPIAKAFGFEGIGEGIVWVGEYKGQLLRFKVKGELHSKSKVKTLNTVDSEKVDQILFLAKQVTPEWRLQQMLEQSCDLLNGGQLDRSKLGDYIRLVINDVVKEELDVIAETGLELKDINKPISDIARKYFFEQEKV